MLFPGKQVNVEATFLSADRLTERVFISEYDLVPSLTKPVSNSSPSDDGLPGASGIYSSSDLTIGAIEINLKVIRIWRDDL